MLHGYICSYVSAQNGLNFAFSLLWHTDTRKSYKTMFPNLLIVARVYHVSPAYGKLTYISLDPMI